MRRNIFLFFASLALFCCAACSSPNTPEAVARKAVRAMQKQDYEEYTSTIHCLNNSNRHLVQSLVGLVGKSLEEKGGIDRYRIARTDIQDDRAKVSVHLVYGNKEEEDIDLFLKKTDGVWLQELK